VLTVEMIWTELAAPHPVFELVCALESGTGFFDPLDVNEPLAL
jgi:hypothetical protein